MRPGRRPTSGASKCSAGGEQQDRASEALGGGGGLRERHGAVVVLGQDDDLRPVLSEDVGERPVRTAGPGRVEDGHGVQADVGARQQGGEQVEPDVPRTHDDGAQPAREVPPRPPGQCEHGTSADLADREEHQRRRGEVADVWRLEDDRDGDGDGEPERGDDQGTAEIGGERELRTGPVETEAGTDDEHDAQGIRFRPGARRRREGRQRGHEVGRHEDERQRARSPERARSAPQSCAPGITDTERAFAHSVPDPFVRHGFPRAPIIARDSAVDSSPVVVAPRAVLLNHHLIV